MSIDDKFTLFLAFGAAGLVIIVVRLFVELNRDKRRHTEDDTSRR
jgi:hypothetical protein